MLWRYTLPQFDCLQIQLSTNFDPKQFKIKWKHFPLTESCNHHGAVKANLHLSLFAQTIPSIEFRWDSCKYFATSVRPPFRAIYQLIAEHFCKCFVVTKFNFRADIWSGCFTPLSKSNCKWIQNDLCLKFECLRGLLPLWKQKLITKTNPFRVPVPTDEKQTLICGFIR